MVERREGVVGVRGIWAGALALCAVVVAAGAVAARIEIRATERFRAETMLFEARMVVESARLEQVERLSGTAADVSSPVYADLRERLVRARAANPSYRYLYIFGQRPGAPPFFFMGTAPEDSADYSPPGQVYFERSPTLELVFAGSDGAVSPPFTDRWGTWVSALVPVRAPDGRLLGVFGMDMDAERFDTLVWLQATTPVVFAAVVVLLVAALTLAWTRHLKLRELRLAAEATAELGRFFDVVPEPLCALDVDGRVVQANRTLRDLLGVPVEGRAAAELVRPDDRPALEEALEAARRGEPVEVRLRLAAQGGVRTTVWRARRHGDRVYAGGRDTTERERMEQRLQQAEKLEAIGRLVGGTAHDFNNLLQAVVGAASLACRGAAPGSETRRQLDEILATAERATGLTRQLLAFTRQHPPEPQHLDLHEVVGGFARIARRLLGSGISLEITETERPGKVLADRTRIEQVILNLCVNARDAMPAGGRVCVELSARTFGDDDAHPGRWAVLAVRDDGVGMDEATLARVFEPFFTTKADSGTGLGLATVHEVVEEAHGFIEVESRPGAGTSFRVYLPVAEPPEAVEQPPPPAPGRGETILLAEDDEAVRNLATRVLADAGYRVLAAADGTAALALHREHAPAVDLLFSDAVMPGRDLLLETVRREQPDLPCIITSGFPEPVGAGGLSGHTLLLPKPYFPDDLLRTVRRALDEWPRSASAPPVV